MPEGLPRPSRCESMFWPNLLISAFPPPLCASPSQLPTSVDTTPHTHTRDWPGDPKFINMGHVFPVCTVYLTHWWPQNLLLIQTLKVQSEGIDSQKFYLTHKFAVSGRSLVKYLYRQPKCIEGSRRNTGSKCKTPSKPVVSQTSLHGSLEMLQDLHRGEREDKQARS